MSDQVTEPDAGEIVWAKSRVTGRHKRMSRAKLAILSHGWEAAQEPGEQDEVVPPMSASTTEEHPERRTDAPQESAPQEAAAAPAPVRQPRPGRVSASEEN